MSMLMYIIYMMDLQMSLLLKMADVPRCKSVMRKHGNGIFAWSKVVKCIISWKPKMTDQKWFWHVCMKTWCYWVYFLHLWSKYVCDFPLSHISCEFFSTSCIVRVWRWKRSHLVHPYTVSSTVHFRGMSTQQLEKTLLSPFYKHWTCENILLRMKCFKFFFTVSA